ncbi:MAG: LysM peptidoglycan-binding domain-containing protein, partial [Clostridia bacterium]
RLTFDIRWFEDEEKEEKTEQAEEKMETAAESRSEEKPKEPPKPAEPPRAQETTCPCHTRESQKEPPRKAEEKKADDLTEKLEAIGETWRETIKTINESDEVQTAAEEDEKTEEVEIKCCPYSKFCLRYYRTREGDELEEIAERFSATVAKLKEFNRLDTTDLPAGKMLRIP